jgi:hypothetical protein
LRKATPQKKTLRRSKKSPSVLLWTVCARRTGLSGAHTLDSSVHQGTPAQRLVQVAPEEKTTGLSGVSTRLSGVEKPAAPTVTCTDRATARSTGHATVHCPVHHRTVRCAAENCSFSPTTILELGPIYTSPNRSFEGVGAQATYQGI